MAALWRVCKQGKEVWRHSPPSSTSNNHQVWVQWRWRVVRLTSKTTPTKNKQKQLIIKRCRKQWMSCVWMLLTSKARSCLTAQTLTAIAIREVKMRGTKTSIHKNYKKKHQKCKVIYMRQRNKAYAAKGMQGEGTVFLTGSRLASNLSQAKSSNISRRACIPLQISIALYCTNDSKSILEKNNKSGQSGNRLTWDVIHRTCDSDFAKTHKCQ